MGFKADSNKKIKFKEPAYKLRPADNPLSWKFLMNLPGLNENNATQIGALYSMLGGIDDNDLDMTPLKPWMEMMDFSFNEIYCILLYLWFILDVELPAAPYPFIGIKREQKKKEKVKNQNNGNKNNKRQQNMVKAPKQTKKQNQKQIKKNNKKQKVANNLLQPIKNT